MILFLSVFFLYIIMSETDKKNKKTKIKNDEKSIKFLIEIKIDLSKKKITELNYLGAQEEPQSPCKLCPDQLNQI